MKNFVRLFALAIALTGLVPAVASANDFFGDESEYSAQRDFDSNRRWQRPGRPGRDWDNGRRGGQVSCTAGDAGWEEHWGGHRSCGECLAKHGKCIETCSTKNYVCRANGQRRGGQAEFFEAYSARSEFEARDEALRRCYYSGAKNCTVSQCNTNNQVVSRRSCR